MSDVALKLNNGNTVYVTQEFADKMVSAGKGELAEKRQFSRAMFSDASEGVGVDVAPTSDRRAVETGEITASLGERAYNTRFEDRGGTAFIGSALSGATFGLSDVVAKHLLGVNMEVQDSIRAQNSTASVAGTITGAVGSALLTGGSGLLAKGAAITPAGRTAMAGERISAALGGGVKGLAAQGAAEGAVMASLQTISDMSVGRKDFSAEALLSEIGHGAILGGAVGGGLGLTAKGARAVLSRGERKAAEAAEASARKGEIAPAYATKGDDGLYRVPGDDVKAPKDAPRMTARQMISEQKKGQAVMKKAMESVSDDVVVNMAAQREVIDEIESVRTHWDNWNRKTRSALESAALADGTIDGVAIKTITKRHTAAYHKSQFLNSARDALKRGDSKEFIRAIEEQKELIALFKKDFPTAARVVDEAGPAPVLTADMASRIDPNASVKFLAQKVRENPLWLARTEDELNVAVNAMAEFKVAASKMRGIDKKLDKAMDQLDDQLAKFDPEAGFAGLDDVDAVKDRLAVAWSKERMIQHADKAPGKAKKAWDKLKGDGNGGMMVGAMLGAGMDSMMGALGLGVLMKSDLVKNVLGYGVKKGLGLAAKADSPVVWRSIVSGTNLTPSQRKDYFQDEEKQLSAVINSQESVAQSIRDKLPEMFVSPQMLSTAVTRSMTAAAYLLGKLPAVLGDKTPFGLGTKFVPSPSDVEKYARVKAVANNPMYAVGRFADGRISPEEAETFRELWPELHREAVSNVLDNLDAVRDALSYERQVSLSILLGVPVASALKPETLMQIQASYSLPPQQGGAPNAGPSKQGENEATKAQSLAK